MPLHLTKVAYGLDSLSALDERVAQRAAEGRFAPTTRYLPKRHAEMAGGSLYWIVKHQLVARSPLIGFGEEDGRVAIELEPRLILVQPRGKRAHQGWRYLEDADAPIDMGGGLEGVAQMPPALIGRLNALMLL